MNHFPRKIWLEEEGQDIAEYSLRLRAFIASGEKPV
jgi:hypothetical protein